MKVFAESRRIVRKVKDLGGLCSAFVIPLLNISCANLRKVELKGKVILGLCCSIFVVLVLCVFCTSGSKVLKIKGLHVRMSGDDAAAVCRKLAAESSDLVALDFRKGIEREKDDETKSREQSAWASFHKLAETDVDQCLEWYDIKGYRSFDPFSKECSQNATRNLGEGRLAAVDRRWHEWVLWKARFDFAQVAGLQCEWMLPGKRIGVEQEAPRPVFVTADKIRAPEFNRRDIWQYLEIERFQNLCDKGLVIHREFRGSRFLRLVLENEKGYPIKKSELAVEIASLYPRLFEEGSSNTEMLKQAEKYVEVLLHWVEVWSDGRGSSGCRIPAGTSMPKDILDWLVASCKREYRATSRREWPNEKKVGRDELLEMAFGSVGYNKLMTQLITDCNVSVECAVLAEPLDGVELISGTFAVPAAKDYRDMENKIDGLERMVEGCVGDGKPLRKKLFFKHNLEDVGAPVFFRLTLKSTNGVAVAKEEVVKKFVDYRGYREPSPTVKIAPRNLIEVAIDQKGVADDKKHGLCFITTDRNGNVNEILFGEMGIGRFWGAEDISTEEFAELLVGKYPGLPELVHEGKRRNVRNMGVVEEHAWEHMSPEGYRVKLFERTYTDLRGVKYDASMFMKNPGALFDLTLEGLQPQKYLRLTAMTPELDRRFD